MQCNPWGRSRSLPVVLRTADCLHSQRIPEWWVPGSSVPSGRRLLQSAARGWCGSFSPGSRLKTSRPWQIYMSVFSLRHQDIEINCGGGHTTLHILKDNKLHTLSGRIGWYANYISVKLFYLKSGVKREQALPVPSPCMSPEPVAAALGVLCVRRLDTSLI